MQSPLRFEDGGVVDARVAALHEAVGAELPLFVAVGAVPLAAVVAPFVFEADGNAVFGEGPKLFAQAVVELAVPFAAWKGPDLLAAIEKFRAVSPLRVLRVSQRDALGVAGVPGVFGGLHFGARGGEV